jgi:hypothetical protein
MGKWLSWLYLAPFGWRLVDLVAFADGANFGVHRSLLFEQHAARLEVSDLRQHRTLHDCSAFVIFDVSHPLRLVQCDLLRETLLLKIANSVIIGIGEEVHDIAGGFDVVFQVAHKMRSVSFDLLIAADGAEHNFGELAALEWSICDSSDDFSG